MAPQRAAAMAAAALALGSLTAASTAASTAGAADPPILVIVNCTDAGASGWAHTAAGLLSPDGGKTCATVLQPVGNGGVAAMLPCGTAPNQVWNLNASFFPATPNASTGILLPEHADTPGDQYGWTFGVPFKHGTPVVIYEIGQRFHGECTGHLNCQFTLQAGHLKNYQGACVGTAPYQPPAPPPPAPPPPPPFASSPCTTKLCFSWTQGSHMVLQQAPSKGAVYGTLAGATAGSAVAVTVTPTGGGDDAAYTVKADVTAAAGNATWKAFLKPTPAGGNYTIKAACTSGCSGEAEISDVTFGDVWYCAGDSRSWLVAHTTPAHRRRRAPAQQQHGRRANPIWPPPCALCPQANRTWLCLCCTRSRGTRAATPSSPARRLTFASTV
jgi:hypothetical protein